MLTSYQFFSSEHATARSRSTGRGDTFASRDLTLLFGKVFFRIHFALGLEGLSQSSGSPASTHAS